MPRKSVTEECSNANPFMHSIILILTHVILAITAKQHINAG